MLLAGSSIRLPRLAATDLGGQTKAIYSATPRARTRLVATLA